MRAFAARTNSGGPNPPDLTTRLARMPPGKRRVLKKADRAADDDKLSSNSKRDVNPAPQNNANAILCFTIPSFLSGYLQEAKVTPVSTRLLAFTVWVRGYHRRKPRRLKANSQDRHRRQLLSLQRHYCC